jgi:hypothetical protein
MFFGRFIKKDLNFEVKFFGFCSFTFGLQTSFVNS